MLDRQKEDRDSIVIQDGKGFLYSEKENRVVVKGQVRDLRGRQAAYVRFLVQHAGQIVTTEELRRHVFSERAIDDYGPSSLATITLRVRKKVEVGFRNPKRIVKKGQVGYIFNASVENNE